MRIGSISRVLNNNTENLYNSIVYLYNIKMKSITKTRIIDNSLVLTIPSDIVKNQRIRENELVEIELKKLKKDFFGTLKGIGSFTEEDKIKGQFE